MAAEAEQMATRERQVALAFGLDSFNKFLLAAAPVACLTRAIARAAAEALGLERGLIFHVDMRERRLRGLCASAPEPLRLRSIQLPFDQAPWLAASVLEGGCSYAKDAEQCHVLPSEDCRSLGLGALLSVPIRCHGRPCSQLLLDRVGEPFAGDIALRQAGALLGASISIALTAGRRAAAGRVPKQPDADPGTPEVELAPATGAGPAVRLTARQCQILGLLARGLSNKEIAATSGISVFTVRDHVSELLRCLGAANRAAAVRRAWEQGLLGAPGQGQPLL